MKQKYKEYVVNKYFEYEIISNAMMTIVLSAIIGSFSMGIVIANALKGHKESPVAGTVVVLCGLAFVFGIVILFMRTHLIDSLKLNTLTQKGLDKYMNEKYEELDIGSTIVLSKEKEFKGIGPKYVIKDQKANQVLIENLESKEQKEINFDLLLSDYRKL